MGAGQFCTNPGLVIAVRGSELDAFVAAATEALAADPELSHEVFGSSSIVVRAQDWVEVARLIAGLEGQLTATSLFDEADQAPVAPLIRLLAERSGRILANGWPTGVEVAHAMVHGGPFPVTSDSRTTLVGTLAIARFLRPVCFQNLPDRLLPEALKGDNPYGVPRRLDTIDRVAWEIGAKAGYPHLYAHFANLIAEGRVISISLRRRWWRTHSFDASRCRVSGAPTPHC